MEVLQRMAARRPLLVETLLAVGVLPLAVMGTGTLNPGPHDLPYVLWAIAFSLPLIVVVRHPEWTLILSLPALVAQWIMVDVPTVGNIVPLIALAFLAGQREWSTTRRWTLLVLVGTLLLTLDWTTSRRDPGFDVGRVSTVVVLCLVTAGLVVGAMLVGRNTWMQRQQAVVWRDLAQQLERDQQLAIELSTAQERSRIAADMHDVLAHSLAVIAVQTDAASVLLRQDAPTLEQKEAALHAIDEAHAAAAEALRETRVLVSSLDEPTKLDKSTKDRAPQPTLAMLPELTARLDPAGDRFRVVTELDLAEVAVPRTVQVAIYRIVQEALTNVVRHAGPNAHAEVRVGFAGESVQVDVVDDGTGLTQSDETGHGLRNMAQRAQSVGGSLSTGAESGGGFRVTARIPVAQETRIQ